MSDVLELRELCVDDRDSFLSALEEIESESPDMEFAFDYKKQCDFAAYVEKVKAWSEGVGLMKGFVPNSYWVGIVSGKVVGGSL